MLIKCTTCGRDISDIAVACPECGQPPPRSSDSKDNDLAQPSISEEPLAKGCLKSVVSLMISTLAFCFFCDVLFWPDGFAVLVKREPKLEWPVKHSSLWGLLGVRARYSFVLFGVGKNGFIPPTSDL